MAMVHENPTILMDPRNGLIKFDQNGPKICCRMKFFQASDGPSPPPGIAPSQSRRSAVVAACKIPGDSVWKSGTGVLRSYLPRGIRVPNGAGNPRILDVISMA